MTSPNDPKRPNWWRRRSGKQQVALVVGVLLVLLVLTPTDDPEPAAAAKDTKPKRQAASADDKKPTAKKPTDAIQLLERDVRKNAKDQVGGKRVKSVYCAKDGRDVLCTVDYRLGDMWDADDDEVARDVGGMLHELFRDTKVQYLHVNALTTTVDELGNETKDDQVAWVIIRRSGWTKVDWDNLQYQSPMQGLRAVSEVYADTLTN